MQRPTPPRYRPPLKRPQQVESGVGSFVGRCPNLGTMADAGTALAFASDANQCYSTRLPVPISMVHQQSYCLAGGYTECPVYKQNPRFGEPAPLVTAPPSWGVPQEETVTNVVIAPARTQQTRRSPILPLVLLLALLAGGWWLWHGYLSQPDSAQETAPDGLAIGEATAITDSQQPGTALGDAGQSAVATNPTATPTPELPVTEEADAASGPGISLPILPTSSPTETGSDAVLAAECSIPDWWVPYVVQDDDTVAALSQVRGLSAEEVLAGNCLPEGELVAGQVVLLPPLATVIGLTPAIVATRIANVGGSIVIVATQSSTTQTPALLPSPTPFATADTGGAPDELPTSQPPQATAIPPTPVPPTATPPGLFPTATPTVPGPTSTPPSTLPTATPPFAGPTQTPPPVRP